MFRIRSYSIEMIDCTIRSYYNPFLSHIHTLLVEKLSTSLVLNLFLFYLFLNTSPIKIQSYL